MAALASKERITMGVSNWIKKSSPTRITSVDSEHQRHKSRSGTVKPPYLLSSIPVPTSAIPCSTVGPTSSPSSSTKPPLEKGMPMTSTTGSLLTPEIIPTHQNIQSTDQTLFVPITADVPTHRSANNNIKTQVPHVNTDQSRHHAFSSQEDYPVD
eukprot:CAMPEP_0171315124 /NCGR_PEP_ID=MMETSP0816-20121228/60481_1 /TAXON_ID=420281 /ORGANISM="Proboscia inermis, Strain CCAP1064/1" /LENGTH=154 /DNA_ID=CAMNT_0011805201 /DNA_START=102 /DNA_END=564 /DNA_ORIENTATION=-